MLTLRLELLGGRYVASTFNDRNRPEWPPHPARVFSALVAAHHEGARSPASAVALRWLETQPPPALAFSPASPRDVATHYVPVNDKALSDGAMVDNAWAEVLAPDLPPTRRSKAEARLTAAYAKAGAPSPTLGKEFRKAVEHVLPATRTKQPRTLPSVTPEDPVVWLTWPREPPPEVQPGLHTLARHLVRVGHSSSLVAASFTAGAGPGAPAPTWIPDPQGPQTLRWVAPGQLDALQALHAASPSAEQRVMPYVVARYRPVAPTARARPWRSSFSPRFIVLRRVAGPRLPLSASEPLADAVRRALMSHADDPRAPLLSGHELGGEPLQSDHLAVVPLANVGNCHASGDVLGVALVPPAALGPGDLRPLYVAIARWEAAAAPSGDGPRAELVMGRLGRWGLERCIDLPPLHNLQETTWTRASRTWASVTPVRLDRHPGSLHEGRSARRRRAIDRAHAIITAACERIGLPAPVEIELSPSPLLTGSLHASAFGRRPGGPPDHRPRLHVWLRFAEPVQGPVILGAGRYRGLGLLRPLGDRLHD